MKANNPTQTARRRWLWPGIGAAALMAWTACCHIQWLRCARPGLHGVPAFFLGLLALLLVIAVIHLAVGFRKQGWRWQFSREAWRVRGWLALFAVSTVALFYNVELWRGKRAWVAVTQEAARRGEKLELQAHVPGPVPDEQNFAMAPFFAPLLTATNGRPADRDALLPGDTGQFNFVARWEQHPFLTGRHVEWRIKMAPWLEGEVTDLRSWLVFFGPWATNDPVANPGIHQPVPDVTAPAAARMILDGMRQTFDSNLESLRAYSARPYCRFPLDYSTQMIGDARPGHVLGGFMSILRLRASAALAAGEDESALADVQLALRVADYIRQQPWAAQTHRRLFAVVDTLQPVWEGLAAHRWKERQLAALQAQLQALDLLADYPNVVRNDAFAVSCFIERLIPTSSATPRILPLRPPEDASALQFIRLIYPTGWSLQDQAAIHRYHLESTSRYLDVNARRVAGFRGDPNALFATSDPLFPILIIPKAKELFDEAQSLSFAQTAVDLAALACALERHRLAHGELPATLDAVAPQFIAKIPHDIITGEPLKYRRVDGGGFALYSVGFNKTDDGGKACPRFPNWRHRIENRFRLHENDWPWIQPGNVTEP